MLPQVKTSAPRDRASYLAQDQEAWEQQQAINEKRLCQEFRRQQYFFGFRPCA